MSNLSINKLGYHDPFYLTGKNWLSSIFPAEISYLIRRHAWVFLAIIITTLACATLYVLMAPRIYTANAQLLLDPRNPQPIAGVDRELNSAFENPEVESQITILQSEELLARVLTALKLNNDPEFVSGRDGTTGQSEADMSEAIASLKRGLDVRRVKLSYTLDIFFSSRDSEKAARIANAVADAYVEDQLAVRSQIASQGTKWLEQRIDEARRQVNEAVLKAQEYRARRDYRIQQHSGTGEVSTSAEKGPQVTLDELESTALTYKKLYESYLQAYTASLQRQALPASMARVITRASPPLKPSHPRTQIILGASILIGLLGGYGIALIRHLLDNSIRGPLQIQKAGLNYLGELRELNRPADRVTSGESRFNWMRNYLRGRQTECISNRIRMVADEPLSQFGIDISALERNLTLMTTAKTPRYFGVLPTATTERATEVACNLAHLFALKGKRVLLVDSDVHSATLTRAFAKDANNGLAQVLLGSAEARDCIVVKAVGDVDVLPAGVVAGPTNTTWSFAPARLKERLAQILVTYDVVFFNLPPAAFNEAKVALSISTLLEGVIIIADYGRTQIPSVRKLSAALRAANVEFVGVAVAMAGEIRHATVN